MLHITGRHWSVLGRTRIVAARFVKHPDVSRAEAAAESRDTDRRFGGFCPQVREHPESSVGVAAFRVSKLYPASMAMFHSFMALAWLLTLDPMPQCTCLT